MNLYANTLYSVILFSASGISFFIAALAWMRRDRVSCAFSLGVNNFANGIWAFFYAIHWTNFFRPSEFFWVDMTYFGVVLAPTALFIFALCYARLITPRLRKGLRLVLLIPIFILFSLWTDPWFGFFFAGKRQSGSAVILDGGIGFWLSALWLYALMFASIIIFVQAFFRYPQRYRGQVGMVLLGILIPVVVNVISLAGLVPLPNLDLTPAALSLNGLFFAIAIFRHNFLDLMPVNRDYVFETHRDYIAILDRQQRIIDLNPNFRELFSSGIATFIGTHFDFFREHYRELPQPRFALEEEHYEFSLNHIPDRLWEMVVFPMRRKDEVQDGYVMTIRDITIQKKAQEEVMDANEQLKKKLEEIEKLRDKLREETIRDPLTNLYNRRHLHEMLLHTLPRVLERNWKLSLAILDIDYFKQTNDTYGHYIGDEVLVNFGDFLLKNTRHNDTVCRFGGEEFMVVFTNASKEAVLKRIEHWLKDIATQRMSETVPEVQISFSCGIVSFPQDGEDMDSLFKKADDCLYQAKAAGRNRVVAA
jgi:diguanylate cyclase (GGDEF)-like protein/PAS domain S-box-containing protein